MSKHVKIEYNGQTYKLTFTKATVKQCEQNGFRLNDIDNMPGTMIDILVRGAFMKEHPFIKQSLVEEIYDQIVDKKGFLSVLTDLYNEPLAGLIADPEKSEKNATWTMEG